MDAENIISFATLVSLLTFFYFAFTRIMQQGGNVREQNRLLYSNQAAA